MAATDNLVWMDLEMTGLDPEKERILEIACIITDASLNVIAESEVIYVKQSEELFAAMDEWNTTHHTATGLIDQVRQKGISEQEAEDKVLDFVSQHTREGKSPLCGNSIGQDRRFLVPYMPRVESWLNYRNIDVSSIKELAIRWRPDLAGKVNKKEVHRALDDIKESIEELKFYQEHFFRI